MSKTTLHFLLKGISILLLIVFLHSCKTKKTIITAVPPKQNVDKESAKKLEAQLKQNEFKFEWLSAKFATEIKLDSSSFSFSVTARIRKDSAIWMSISPLLGIEAARVLITKDSVKFMNRIKSEYFSGDYNYINQLLHAELDYDLLQALLVGNSVEFYNEDEKLKSAVDNGYYLLSTIRKRKLKKVVEKNKELKEPAQSIWMHPETNKIVKILFFDFEKNRSFDATFDSFEKIDTQLFPNKINYTIKAEKNVAIQLDYSKVSINSAQTFPFTVPSSYDRVTYQKNK